MPSKESQHLAFFFVLLISVGMHWYVYTNLKRLLLRDFPKLGEKLAQFALGVFVIGDLPFLFLFFRGMVHGNLATLTRAMLYPFSVWQIILLMWAIVLVPFSLWRQRERLGLGWIRERIRHAGQDSAETLEDEIALEVATE